MNKVKLEQMEGTDTRDMKIKQEDASIGFLDGLASSDNQELGRLVDAHCVGVKTEVKEELKAEEKDDEKDYLDAMRVFPHCITSNRLYIHRSIFIIYI